MFKSLAHWGGSMVTGRGLLALAGQGSISQILLREGETYIVHPRYNCAARNRKVVLTHSIVMSSLTVSTLIHRSHIG